jgi:UDP-glucose 4-epimerase
MWMAPLTPYAASKLSGEALVASYAASFGLSAITYRFFNIFGPWQRPDHDYAAVIPKWIWKLMHGQNIEVFGDGSQSRDFTYIDTVVSVLFEGLRKSVKHPTPVNLAFGTQITLRQCVDEFRLIFPNLDVNYLPVRAGDVKNSQNNPTLLESIFPGVKPIGFSEALEKTCQWFLENGSRIANGPQPID